MWIRCENLKLLNSGYVTHFEAELSDFDATLAPLYTVVAHLNNRKKCSIANRVQAETADEFIRFLEFAIHNAVEKLDAPRALHRLQTKTSLAYA